MLPACVVLLPVCVIMLAGCGDGGADKYQTFQPAGQAGAAMAAVSEPAVADAVSPAVEAAAAVAAAGAAAGPVPEAGPVAEAAASPSAEPVAAVPAASAAGSSATSATIVSAQTGLSGPADRPVIDNGVAGEVRQIQLLVPQKRFRRERPSEAVRVSYDDIDLLKVLNMEPVPADAVGHFPEWLKSLDGKLVRIRGFMFPTFVATGLTEFALARDNGICCFVRQPKIYDIMNVQLAEGETTDYIANRPFDVEGIFRIDPDADQPQLSRLYRIEQAKVLQ
jgi:hypothetical protein